MEIAARRAPEFLDNDFAVGLVLAALSLLGLGLAWRRRGHGGVRGVFRRWLGLPVFVAKRRAELPPEQGRVLSVYLCTPRLWEKFPTALLASGRPGFFRWLIKHGRRAYAFTDDEILDFMLRSEQGPPEFALYTYLVQPTLQQQFPQALSPQGAPEYLAALADWGHARAVPLQPFLECAHAHDLVGSGVNLLGHFCFVSGLREAARQTAGTLRSGGYQLSLRDIPVGQKADRGDRTDFLGLEPFATSIAHLTPSPFFQTVYERAGLAARPGVYRIGICSWELPEIPWDWLVHESWLDEIWAPSTFITEGLQRAGVREPRLMIPSVEIGPFPRLTRAEFALPERGYLFFFMFDMCSQMDRKNPLGLIEAFQRAFPQHEVGAEPVHLAIKVSHGVSDPAAFAELQAAAASAGVQIIDEVMTRERSYALLDLADAYVSLHRSEGFGFTMAEAMLLGKPVIATGYSGNLEFMNEGNSLLVRCGWMPVGETQSVYPVRGTWADPDLDHAAEHFRWLVAHPAEGRALGAKARGEASALLSNEAATERLVNRLHAIEAERYAARLSQSELAIPFASR